MTKTNLLFFFIFLLVSCRNEDNSIAKASDNNRNNDSTANSDSNKNISKIKTDSLDYRYDTLNNDEQLILAQISKEDEYILLSKKVKRYYSKNNASPIYNELVYQEDSLIKNGYVYMELSYRGEISELNISYQFSLGQASVGYGSVIGNSLSNYVHIYSSCGTSSCITIGYRNNKKIFEKNTPN